MYLLATGHTLLNHFLREKAGKSESIDYLEGIELATSLYRPKTIIFSEYIYTLSSFKDSDERYQFIFNIIKSLREYDVRTIMLVSFHAPAWFYQKCISIGVYDLILTDSKIEKDTIYSFMDEVTTKEQAENLLSSLSLVWAPEEQLFKEELPHNSQIITIDDTFPDGMGISFSFSQLENELSLNEEEKERIEHVQITI